MTRHYLFLLAAVVFEVVATTALARSDSFTRLLPSLITIAGYSLAFWCLSFPLQVMATGVVYAIWSGLGLVFISMIAWVWHGQSLDVPALVGLTFIIAGVAIVNIFSKSVVH